VTVLPGAGSRRCWSGALRREGNGAGRYQAPNLEYVADRRDRYRPSARPIADSGAAYRRFRGRMESFSVDNIERRLARALIRLSDRMGTPGEDGSERRWH